MFRTCVVTDHHQYWIAEVPESDIRHREGVMTYVIRGTNCSHDSIMSTDFQKSIMIEMISLDYIIIFSHDFHSDKSCWLSRCDWCRVSRSRDIFREKVCYNDLRLSYEYWCHIFFFFMTTRSLVDWNELQWNKLSSNDYRCLDILRVNWSVKS